MEKSIILTGVDKILAGNARMINVVYCRRKYNCYLFQFSKYILQYTLTRNIFIFMAQKTRRSAIAGRPCNAKACQG